MHLSLVTQMRLVLKRVVLILSSIISAMSPIFVVNLGLEGTEACKIETQEVRFLTTLNTEEPDHPQKKGLNFKSLEKYLFKSVSRGFRRTTL